MKRQLITYSLYAIILGVIGNSLLDTADNCMVTNSTEAKLAQLGE